MRIGVFQVLANGAAYPAIVAKRAEDLGFESYWVPDHTILPVEYSVPYPGAEAGKGEPEYLWQIPDPIVALSRASGTTKKIGLGTGICLVPERGAILLAKQVASLDDVSGGRFLFGIGAGWNPEESKLLGGDFEHRWTQVKDAIAAMKALWTTNPSEYHGRYVDFPPVRLFPKPVRKPHPPVLLGAIQNPRSLKRVVEWADGWMPIVFSVDEFAHGVEEIRTRARAAGRDPKTIDLTVFGLEGQWQTPDEVRAFEKVGANRVILWLKELKLEPLLRELEALAKAHSLKP